jgi:hypothetical protein
MIEIKLDGIDEVLQQLNPRTYQKAVNRTVNDIGSKMKTKLTKDVRKQYNIQAKDVKGYMKIKRSRHDNIKYEIEVKSKRRNVMRFGAKVLKKRGSVSVRIKKDKGRSILRNSFVTKNGKAILHRVGKTQKIEAVTTISIPQMFNKKILQEAENMVTNEAGNKLKNNFAFYLGKA